MSWISGNGRKKTGHKWQKGFWKSMPTGFLWVDGCCSDDLLKLLTIFDFIKDLFNEFKQRGLKK